MTLRVLVPDTDWARAADWGDIPVELAYYDPADENPPVDDPAEVLLAGAGPQRAVARLADELPRLRYLQAAYAGVERWDARLRPEIQLVNASGAFGRVTAEIATVGLLSLLRRIPEIVRSADRRDWAPVEGQTLGGRRVLVIGAGDVGSHVRHQVEAFGARVTTVARTARDGVRGIEELDELVPEHDVVVVATPLTAATRGLVDADFLARMPDGAVLVNVGRGPIVQTDALVAELESGRLRAVLDVTDPEPLPSEHPLWQAPGVLITPHVGGFVENAATEGLTVAIQQIGQIAAGRTPDNLVTRDRKEP